MPSLWHTVSSVLLITCAMTTKAVTSFSPLHPEILPMMDCQLCCITLDDLWLLSDVDKFKIKGEPWPLNLLHL